MTMRITGHPILEDAPESKTITIYFNGHPYEAVEGDTIASAMLAQGVKSLRVHEETGNGRGIYCNIGHCFECRVKINESQVVRACLTPASEGMEINSHLLMEKGEDI